MPAYDIAIGAVAWLLIVVIVLSWCRAAAIGDRMMDDAREAQRRRDAR